MSRVSELPNLTDARREDLATMSQPFRAPGPRQRLEIKRMLKSAEELAAAEGGGLSADQVLDKTRLYWTHAENNLKGSKEQHEAHDALNAILVPLPLARGPSELCFPVRYDAAHVVNYCAVLCDDDDDVFRSKQSWAPYTDELTQWNDMYIYTYIYIKYV